MEDKGWYHTSAAYAEFLKKIDGEHVLFLEAGVGANTPVIVKYPFWAMTAENPKAVYACLNYNEAFCPKQSEEKPLWFDGDAGEVLKELME